VAARAPSQRRVSRAASQVGECVANWWRPDFEAELYPYVPPHITRPKESKRVFVVHLPEKCYFAVRRLRCALGVRRD
jgi:cleavage and polyadenylation specificity factor subunit 5